MNFNELLRDILEEVEAEYGDLRAPASEAALKATRQRLKEEYGWELPLQYTELLRKANGFTYEETVVLYVVDPVSDDPTANQVHEASEFFSINAHYRANGMPEEYLILGFSDLGLFALNTATGEYEVLDPYGYDVLTEYDDFGSLLKEAVEGPLDDEEDEQDEDEA